MPVTIKGIYENGHIFLTEPAPTDKKVPVNIVFPQEMDEPHALGKNEIRWGSLAGKISLPDNFNDEIDDLNEYR